MSVCCEQDDRREAVRAMAGRVGLDYVEVNEEAPVLYAYFLGDLPPELAGNKPGIERFLRLEGGERIVAGRDLKIVDVDPVTDPGDEQDPYLVVRLDRAGDLSTYTLRLVDVEGTDPRYDHADFRFHVDCPRDLDCTPACVCGPPLLAEPAIDYLAKDYGSFRQLVLDRLAVLMPGWTERHVPDLGIALVELLAYTADYLSYHQDAVATEAYLGTARQRISVRRHVRLVDYVLHEGCNARTWVCLTVSQDAELDPAEMAFVTGLEALQQLPTIVSWEDLADIPPGAYEVFEPMRSRRAQPLQLRQAHNEIPFYTWGDAECCLERGSTRATLLDAWASAPPSDPDADPDANPGQEPHGYAAASVASRRGRTTSSPVAGGKRGRSSSKPKAGSSRGPKQSSPSGSPSGRKPGHGSYGEGPGAGDGYGEEEPARVLDLAPGDVLVFEEVIGPKTGLPADADPVRRHAVRLTRVTLGEDPVVLTKDGRPTPYAEVEWGPEDALPFTLCLSVIGPSPDCRYLTNVSVARGNVVLADHGRSVGPDDLGCVPVARTEAICECAGEPGDITRFAGPYHPHLTRAPLTFSQPLRLGRSSKVSGPSRGGGRRHGASAAGLLRQDVQAALPQVRLTSSPPAWWRPRTDLLASRRGDHHFVVEIDNDGVAHLRFGDGETGASPGAGTTFSAAYRTGNGTAGNVGAEALAHLVLASTQLEGLTITVRNPLPAAGGTDPESVADAKLLAPHQFRKRIERAITADDYSEIAQRNDAIQRASTALTWTGSWYEADVAVDPLGSERAGDDLLREIEGYLWQFRRMGHDLRTVPARYVPIDLGLDVCVKPHFQRGHVKAALLDELSNRVLAGGRLGFFHPDNLTFGQSVFVSRIVAAAMAVPGVACATVTRLQRRFAGPNQEIETGVLPIRSWEIAQLDNDGNHPERGRLDVSVSGGI